MALFTSAACCQAVSPIPCGGWIHQPLFTNPPRHKAAPRSAHNPCRYCERRAPRPGPVVSLTRWPLWPSTLSVYTGLQYATNSEGWCEGYRHTPDRLSAMICIKHYKFTSAQSDAAWNLIRVYGRVGCRICFPSYITSEEEGAKRFIAWTVVGKFSVYK